MRLEVGLEASVEHWVDSPDTARALGSGDTEVLATPFVITLCERAAVAAISAGLDASQTSVGTRISLDHVAPTAVGRRVVARARVQRIDGRRVQFLVDVSDTTGQIAHGEHERMIVDRDRFLAGARDRAVS